MDIGATVLALSQAQDTASLDAIFKDALAAEGVDCYAYVRSFDPTQPDMREGDLRLGNFPDAWAYRYLTQGYDATDPVRLFAFRTAQPFTWSEAHTRIAAERALPPILDEAADMGLKTGGSISIFGPSGRMYSLSFASATPGVESDWRLPILGLLAHQVHLAYERLAAPAPPPPTPLTRREQDVLHWCARGKSNGDISDIMGISANTVDYHMRRIYMKLGVNSRTPAALMGIMNGLIAP